MTFEEAMKVVAAGNKVRRAAWGNTATIQQSYGVAFDAAGNVHVFRMLCSTYGDPTGRYNTPMSVSAADLRAKDWEDAGAVS